MKWELITEKKTLSVREGKRIRVKRDVEIPTDRQIDAVGNIYQKTGGVIPVACQNCGTKFANEIKKTPIEESVPIYKCKKCEFVNASGDLAWDHEKANTGHKIAKDKGTRIVGFNTILTGVIPRITKTEDDVIILCDQCNAVKKF